MTESKIDFQKIAKHAEENRWSARKVAEKAGMSDVTVQRVFNGTANPSATNLKAICDTIGLSVEEVFITEAEAA